MSLLHSNIKSTVLQLTGEKKLDESTVIEVATSHGDGSVQLFLFLPVLLQRNLVGIHTAELPSNVGVKLKKKTGDQQLQSVLKYLSICLWEYASKLAEKKKIPTHLMGI